MPVYEYRCRQCGEVHEAFVRSLGSAISSCPSCGSENLERLVSASYMVRMNASAPGTTCCGRTEQCDAPPCSTGEVCHKR